MCVSADAGGQNVVLGDCSKSSRWFRRRGNHAIMLSSADHLCMHFVGEGQPVTLSTNCDDQLSSWWPVAMFQFVSGSQGKRMCLDGGNSQPGSTGVVITTTECDCLGTVTCQENPQTQWFSFVTTNKGSKTKKQTSRPV
ncbi:hypothetical protein QJS10_CPB22g00038 [Acorus calamus]|uniref:Uncharacterized protein n=1 Tax=Acorus calamus TaxID=4465 RepID=A0AAV9BXY5_ACOCL|nr:hypothetical protein QJS10_CPB22g00038 [Acorus calamus]